MGKSTNDRDPLLPARHETADFFVCDLFDAAPKSDMASMEHPVFSVSTKPDKRIRRYENGANYVEITPSVKGLATVHDRDVLIFIISQIMGALNEGKAVSRTVRFTAYHLLVATNRGTDGRGYEQLRAAFERLAGTRIVTNLTTDDQEILDGFGLIDRYRIVRETRDGRMLDVEVTLSDWVFNAIRANEVLTLHRDYFRLRKPLERRMYELARKHCGRQAEWRISLENLQRKCGSNSTAREFRRLVATICDQDTKHAHMPNYSVHLADDVLIVRNRGTLSKLAYSSDDAGRAAALAMWQPNDDEWQEARKASPGWDVQTLLRDWKAWAEKQEKLPRNTSKAFIGFCRKKGPCRG